MNALYFIVVEGVQRGPYPREVLRMQGMQPETYVWREGMSGWERAGDMPELADLFMEEGAGPGPSYQQPVQPQQPYWQQPQQPYRQPQPPYPAYRPHTNWLPWAIASTVLNCLFSCIGLVFSIIGIVQANKANNLYAMGYEGEGDAANSNAKLMTIISLVIAGIGVLTCVSLLVSGVGSIYNLLSSGILN